MRDPSTIATVQLHMKSNTVCYLRAGRRLRASGEIIERSAGMTKVKPHRPGWGAVWITESEIEAGKEKAPYKPRERREGEPKPITKPRTPKPPRWQQLVARVRIYEIDHSPKGWPAVEMALLTALADELEQARREVAAFLPLI